MTEWNVNSRPKENKNDPDYEIIIPESHYVKIPDYENDILPTIEDPKKYWPKQGYYSIEDLKRFWRIRIFFLKLKWKIKSLFNRD